MKIFQMLASVRFWFVVNATTLALLVGVQFGFADVLQKWKFWPDLFGILVNLLTGGVISFLFYFLVVYVPQQRKKRIIKNNLRKMYLAIKHDILWQIIFASIRGGRTDLTTDPDEIDRLMYVENFRAAFEHGAQADEGFYAFENQMSEETFEFREIVVNLEVLSKQIDYVLHNYTIDTQKIFDFFKRLEAFLFRMRYLRPGYDESKALCAFIWEIFAGFDKIYGYRGYDIVERMIEDIQKIVWLAESKRSSYGAIAKRIAPVAKGGLPDQKWRITLH